MLLKNKEEMEFFNRAILRVTPFKNVVTFFDSKQAFDAAMEQQFDLFITRMEVLPLSGVVFIQKLRQTPQYGHEIQFFIADKIDDRLIQTLHEQDISYVLVKPFSPDRIEKKLKHLLTQERRVSAVEKLYREAKAALHQGQFDSAIEFANKAKQTESHSEKVLALLGEIEFRKNNLEQARSYLESALAINPKSAHIINKLAKTYIAEKNFAKSAELLDQLPEAHPYNINLLENAGLSQYEIGNKDKANAIVGNLVQIDQDNVKSIHIQGQIAADEGNFEKMLVTIQKNLSGRELLSFINNKAIAISNNDPDKAIALYQQSLAVLEDDQYTYAILYNIGLSYKKKGDLESARDYFVKAIDANPGFEKGIASLKKINQELARYLKRSS